MNNYKEDQTGQNEGAPCLIFDKCKDERFEEFNFPIAYDETSYTRCLLLFQPAVVVVNSTRLEQTDLEALIKSDEQYMGNIVFVILSSDDDESTQTLHKNLRMVRKLKYDCSKNILKFSIQYAIKWGPSGYLKKGRILSDSDIPEEDLVDYPPEEEVSKNINPPNKEQEENHGHQITKHSHLTRLKYAVLTLPIAIVSATYVVNPCALSLDKTCKNFSSSKFFNLQATESNLGERQKTTVKKPIKPKKPVVANLDANKYTVHSLKNRSDNKIKVKTTLKAKSNDDLTIDRTITRSELNINEKREIPTIGKKALTNKSSTAKASNNDTAITHLKNMEPSQSHQPLENSKKITKNNSTRKKKSSAFTALKKLIKPTNTLNPKASYRRESETLSEPSDAQETSKTSKTIIRETREKLAVKRGSSNLSKPLKQPRSVQQSKNTTKKVKQIALSNSASKPAASTGTIPIHDLPFQSQIRIKD